LHGYSTQGVFNVTLTVKDDDFDTGSAKTTVRISDVLPSAEMVTQDQTIEEDSVLELEGKGEDTASDQASLEYRWDFGDGNRSEWNLSPTANITYPAAGRYRITLMVRDDEFSTAASDPVFITVVNLPPRAVAAASAKNVDEDMSVNFTAMASTDTPSDISSLSYQWDFGDGDDAEGSNASHTYQKAGSYTVKLNVVDNDGAASEDSALRIKVRNLPPVAAAASDRTSAKTGEKIGFSANGTDTPSDILGLRFSWDFGDGARAEGRNVIHTYTVEGRYNVRLEVTDPDGEKGEAQLAVDISSAKNAAAPPAGGPSIAIVAGVAAVAIIGSILLVLLFWNRGRRQ
jgi:PKD repeat protein